MEESIWLLILAHSNKERTAQDSLKRAGQTVFLPLDSKGGAAFPGYLFSRLDPGTDVRGLKALMGILTVVNYGGRYTLATDDLIESIRGGTWQEFRPDPWPRGKAVRTNDLAGPFRGIDATVHAIVDDTAILDMIMAGKPVQIKVPKGAIEAA